MLQNFFILIHANTCNSTFHLTIHRNECKYHKDIYRLSPYYMENSEMSV